METTIKTVVCLDDMKTFARFNYELYADNPYSVPDLLNDMVDTLSLYTNPAFDFCDAEFFLAYQGDRLVGRIGGIINHKANERSGKKAVRFGWIDFIDDPDVSAVLLRTVEVWGVVNGMDCIQGPLGFTDFDAEGMLVEGFDQMSTMATIYNYPYYPEHLERLGYRKDVDWLEYKILIPDSIPDKHRRIAELVKEKYNLSIVKCKSRKELKNKYGQAIFELMNESYKEFYGYSPLTQKQIDQYIKKYLPIIDLRMITLVVDADEKLVAVGLSMPSIAEALRKIKGELYPFGWFHLMKALFTKRYRAKMLELLLVAVKPEYQNKGVNALLFYDLIPIYQKLGFIFAESNPELEGNGKVQAQWEYFETQQHKRRRAYTREIS